MEIVIAFILLIFIILLGISFACGFCVGRKTKPTVNIETPTGEELERIKREEKELENFFSYDGRPQSDITGNSR